MAHNSDKIKLANGDELSRAEVVYRYMALDPKLKPAEIVKRIKADHDLDFKYSTVSSAQDRYRKIHKVKATGNRPKVKPVPAAARKLKITEVRSSPPGKTFVAHLEEDRDDFNRTMIEGLAGLQTAINLLGRSTVKAILEL